jgi:hypothetical protein
MKGFVKFLYFVSLPFVMLALLVTCFVVFGRKFFRWLYVGGAELSEALLRGMFDLWRERR